MTLTMDNYSKRVESFTQWPHRDRPKLTGDNMARAGFYSLHRLDEVQCFVCGVRLAHWECDDDPEFEHIRVSPDCPVAVALVHDVVADESLLVAHSYKSAYLRSITFLNNNWPESCPVSSCELVDAGLYYLGQSDKVQCAYCGGKLHSWSPGDQAMDEHRRHFPHCEFVQGLVCEEPVDQRMSLDIDPSSITVYGSPQTGFCSPKAPLSPMPVNCSLKSPLGAVICQAPISPQPTTVNPFLEQTSVEALPEHTVVEPFLEDSLSDPSLVQTKDALQSVKHMGFKNSVIQEAHDNLTRRQSDVTSLSLTLEILDIVSKKRNTGNTVTGVHQQLKLLSLENTQLKDSMMCKICMAAEADHLFIPCDHLVCCDSCSTKCTQCPLCRTVIEKTIKVFK